MEVDSDIMKTKLIQVVVDEGLHKAIKLYCINNNISISKYVVSLIVDNLTPGKKISSKSKVVPSVEPPIEEMSKEDKIQSVLDKFDHKRIDYSPPTITDMCPTNNKLSFTAWVDSLTLENRYPTTTLHERYNKYCVSD